MSGLIAVLAVAALAGPATAQDETHEIDALFEWATPATPGCAVAVSRDWDRVVDRAYGSADLERGVPLTPSSVFDAGSVTKQFVAAAVLLLVDDGRLALADDVRAYIPELPDPGHAITVDHLLTHTSGVRDWTGLRMLSSGDEDALTLVLRQRGLNFAPGEEWSYSNSGYVLLKELVARVTGAPFSAFVQERLFGPLGMAATTYADGVQEAPETLALAYEKRGDRWELDVLAGNARGGGGALLTTAGDLVSWAEALASDRLGAFVTDKLHEPARLNNGRTLGYGRGLFLDDGPGGRVVWHTGSAGSYKSFLGRYPEQGLSIAVLCNAGESADRSAIVRRLYDLFGPAPEADASPAGPEAVAPPAGPEAVDVSARAGLFFRDRTGEPLRLVAQDGRLRVLGGPPLVTVAEDRFRNPDGALGFLSQDAFEVRFVSPDAFDLVSMEGASTRYRRAEPYAPTEAELAAFAGRWESDELRAVLEVAHADGALAVRLNDSRPLHFAPVAPDTFQWRLMTLRFHRGADGTVASLDYSNPVLRAAPFTRPNDGTTGR